jgi:uncharacterized protein (TIGR01244 family)
MKYKPGGSSILLLTIALVSFVGVAQEPERRYQELPNFHQVNEQLYRSGQPKSGGLKKLADFGIKTIVNLRGESDETKAEEAEAKKLGLRYFNIPMSSAGRPTDEQVRHVIDVIESQENAPVLIHCRRGSDRTGAIIAIYRIKREGWAANRALEEAKRYGMGFVQFRKRDYVRDYYKEVRESGSRGVGESGSRESRPPDSPTP